MQQFSHYILVKARGSFLLYEIGRLLMENTHLKVFFNGIVLFKTMQIFFIIFSLWKKRNMFLHWVTGMTFLIIIQALKLNKLMLIYTKLRY